MNIGSAGLSVIRVSPCYKQRWMAIAWRPENRYGDIDPVGKTAPRR